MELGESYDRVIREAVCRHFLKRISAIYQPPSCRATLYRADGPEMVPWLRCRRGEVEVYENPGLRYPKGVPVVGLAWEKAGAPVVLVLEDVKERDLDYFEGALRMPRSLAEVVVKDPNMTQVATILAISVERGPYVLCVESCDQAIVGFKKEDADVYSLLHADTLYQEVKGFSQRL